MDYIASQLANLLKDFPDDWMYKDSWYDKYYMFLKELIEKEVDISFEA